MAGIAADEFCDTGELAIRTFPSAGFSGQWHRGYRDKEGNEGAEHGIA